VFDDQGKDIIFWAASRGHHADVGGILPGSMPPTSREIWEEGAYLESFLLVRNGIFEEQELTRIMLEEPAKYPGCSGTRCLGDNISDLKAQAAANYTGMRLIHQLISEYTMDVVLVSLFGFIGFS
jgi:5-oxoprolinase (ATP-hydrolysing)